MAKTAPISDRYVELRNKRGIAGTFRLQIRIVSRPSTHDFLVVDEAPAYGTLTAGSHPDEDVSSLCRFTAQSDQVQGGSVPRDGSVVRWQFIEHLIERSRSRHSVRIWVHH